MNKPLGKCLLVGAVGVVEARVDGGDERVLAIDDALVDVHHLLDEAEIGDLDGPNGDVAHGSELTAVVQVFVLEPEEVPDKASVDLEKGEHRSHQVLVRFALEADVVEARQPHEPQHQVLHNRRVVVLARRVDEDLAQEAILAWVGVEEAPVHLDVPEVLVARAEEFDNEPQVEERILPVGRVLERRAEVILERERADVEERGGVLGRVGQVRKGVRRVLVAAQALQEAPPARQAGQHQRQHVVHISQYAIVRRRAHSLSIQVFQQIKTHAHIYIYIC